MLPSIAKNYRRSERNNYEQFLYDEHVKRVKSALPTLKTYTDTEDKFNVIKRANDRDYKIKQLMEQNKIILENIKNATKLTNIDNRLNKHVQTVRKFKKELYIRDKRLKFRQITEENKQLLQRIINVEPIYYFTN